MDFAFSPKVESLRSRLTGFMEEHVYPNEAAFRREIAAGDRWQPTTVVEALKEKARAAGLWNLFLPESEYGAGLTNTEYAPLCEIMGRASGFAPEVFNCSAPDTGNMEVLVRYGTPEQKTAVARSAARRRHPLVLRDDRARCRLVGRDQHPFEHRSRRRRLRHQRAQVVDFRRRRPALPHRDLHGPEQPRGAPAPAAVDDPRADGHARRSDQAHAPGVRLRRCAARACRDRVRERARAGRQHAARRGPRLRDRAGTARPRAHSSLHAADRRRRARARADVRARQVACRVRPDDRRAGHDPARHRRVARGDRSGAPVDAARRVSDGHGGQQGRALRDRADQGRRAAHGAARARSRHPGARRRRRLRGLSARARLGARAQPALRRRPGRSASGSDCED